MKNKGGPGSGRHPGGGSNPKPKPKPLASWKPPVPRSGVRPSELYPHGRNPDGSPRTFNDPKPAPKTKP